LWTPLFTKVVLNSILLSLFFIVLINPFYALEFLFQVKKFQLSLFLHLSCCRKPFRFAKTVQSPWAEILALGLTVIHVLAYLDASSNSILFLTLFKSVLAKMKKADLKFSFANYMRYRNLFNSAIKDVSFILNPHKIYLTQYNLKNRIAIFYGIRK